jgi:glycine betaine/proline transport system permease protein
LGLVVLQGLGRLNVGRAAVGGIAIVLLAMMLDRITQKLAEPRPAEQSALMASLWRFIRGEQLAALSSPTTPDAAPKVERTQGN